MHHDQSRRRKHLQLASVFAMACVTACTVNQSTEGDEKRIPGPPPLVGQRAPIDRVVPDVVFERTSEENPIAAQNSLGEPPYHFIGSGVRGTGIAAPTDTHFVFVDRVYHDADSFVPERPGVYNPPSHTTYLVKAQLRDFAVTGYCEIGDGNDTELARLYLTDGEFVRVDVENEDEGPWSSITPNLWGHDSGATKLYGFIGNSLILSEDGSRFRFLEIEPPSVDGDWLLVPSNSRLLYAASPTKCDEVTDWGLL